MSSLSGAPPPLGAEAGVQDPMHPLAALFADLARRVYPPVDGVTEAMPRAAGAAAVVLSFTGHCVVAADVDPAWGSAECPPLKLTAAYSPAFLTALAERVGRQPGALDVLLGAPAIAWAPELPLRLTRALDEHPRVARAYHMRTDVRVYLTEDGAGLLTLGPGVAVRGQAGFEVDASTRNQGLGRRLAAAGRQLIPPGEFLFLQVAPGNAASLRAILAAGFVPLG